MFNRIEPETFNLIKKVLFKAHNYYLKDVEQLNKLYNAPYAPESIKSDIMELQEQDLYSNFEILKIIL